MILTRLIDAADPTRFGGKAVQLGQALRAGLPVPDGHAISVESLAALERQRDEARAVLAALGGPLAVRSSAVGEDSASASFAGQHVSLLNVHGAEAIAEAALEVWRSARSEAVLAYRRRLGIAGEPRIAAVVQRMVAPDRSGVMFTRHPQTGERAFVIEASWGLGEAIVAGLVTPDHFEHAADGARRRVIAGDKDVRIVAEPGGGTRQERVAAEQVAALCLDEDDIAALIDLARACDGVFASDAHDIEFAFEGRRLHLLQRRPITHPTRAEGSR